MNKKLKLMATLVIPAMVTFVFALPVRSEVNDSDIGFEARGALGAGKIFWGYVSHGNNSADLGTGKGGVVNLAGMFNYRFAAIEANLLYGNINELEWEDEDSSGVSHTYKSTGSGFYSVFDMKLGARLFTEKGDMGYTFFYLGGRWWSTERTEDSLEVDGVSNSSQKGKREAKGSGWITGFRDFSTFGPNDGVAFALQTGFFAGKAPVKEFKENGVKKEHSNNDSISFGGEIAGGVALQNIGFSAVAGARGEVNVTTFNDPAAPQGEESVFGFGNIMFFVEAQMQF
jgi:hypothetical protein